MKQISYRRPGLLLIALTFGTAPLFGQTLTLVPSALIIPAQFQHYYDSAETVYLPEGFTAQVYYTGTLSGPRFMAFDPQGNLCVADDNNSIVVRLRDTNNDGIADTAITIASSTDGAHSIAFHGGDLFTAAPDHTYRYSEPDVNGVFTSRQLFIDSVDSAPQGVTNHTTRTILFDDFSNALFMSVGSGCNACRETDTMRASIVRYDQDGTHPTLFASGLRNAVGLAMDSSHHLWATVAERNNQGQDLPGDLITGIEQNQFYGWPLAFGNHEWDDFNLDSEYQAMLPIT
ncbi:MAG TPA: hypothetical protein VFX22_05430, partial [Candidatus Kapabacteria bacterium]|nr:hypothetical protein [Candidatus Kapabacteria bacterium]